MHQSWKMLAGQIRKIQPNPWLKKFVTKINSKLLPPIGDACMRMRPKLPNIDVVSKEHQNFSIETSGLKINPCWPDGIVECSCCGVRCLEIKCPHSYRNSNIQHLNDNDSYIYRDLIQKIWSRKIMKTITKCNSVISF